MKDFTPLANADLGGEHVFRGAFSKSGIKDSAYSTVYLFWRNSPEETQKVLTFVATSPTNSEK